MASETNCKNCGGQLVGDDRRCSTCGASDLDPWTDIVRRLRAATAPEFEIIRELGRGGMAAVYLAREQTLDRQVAMKVMSPALMMGMGMVERFQREARTVAKLNHPNIVTVYAVRQLDDLHFFTMQFVEGRSLDHIVRDVGALPIPMVRSLLHTVGSALAYAHRRGVVHRDVKPGNVLVGDDGTALVTDFGIAKVAQDSTGPFTQTNLLVGTPAYISPEQCYANPATPASDQYALGILAYELVTGRVPFEGSAFAVMQQHTGSPIPPIRAAHPECPPELEAAIVRMLAKDPADRWPTMQHALAELGAAPLDPDDPFHVALGMLASSVPATRRDALSTVVQRRDVSDLPEPSPRVEEAEGERESAPVEIAPEDVAAIRIVDPPSELAVEETFVPTGIVVAPRILEPEVPDAIPMVAAAAPIAPAVEVARPARSNRIRNISAGVALLVVGTVLWRARSPQSPNAVVQQSQIASSTFGDSARATRVDSVSTPPNPVVHVATEAPVASRGATPPETKRTDIASPGGARQPAAPSRGAIDSSRIAARPATIAAVVIATAPPTLLEGARVRLEATARDAGDGVVARELVWRSDNPEVATVDNTGSVTAIKSGVATVSASVDDRVGKVVVTVHAPAAPVYTEPAKPTAPSFDAAADRFVGSTISSFVDSLNADNGDALQRMMSDAASWNQIRGLMEKGHKLSASDLQRAAPQTSDGQLVAPFTIRLVSVSSFGARNNSTASFEAVFAPQGTAWTLRRIRLVSRR